MWISDRNWNSLINGLRSLQEEVRMLRADVGNADERIIRRLNDVSRSQRTLIDMSSREQDLSQELLANLESTTSEVEALSTVIDNLVTAVGNSSDVSPEVQAALDKVASLKARIIALALKGTPSEVPMPPEEPAPQA